MEEKYINSSLTCLLEDPLTLTFVGEEEVRDDEVESVGNESMRVNMNATASDVVSLDDNNSQMSQIDPGNFSESDIDDDVSVENCCPSFFSDVLGGFPESDIEDEEDEMSDAGISFNSDIGSPMHSSCRSYPVSEDRDEREEATPLLLNSNDSFEGKMYPSSSLGEYETYNESEISAPLAHQKDEDAKLIPQKLRNSTLSKRKFSKAQSQPPYPKKNQRTRRSDKGTRKTTFAGKRKALAVMRLLSDEAIPMPIPMTSMYCVPMRGSGKEDSSPTTKSLSSIPILDLCITEDEGYLGMAEETYYSDKEKDENKLPMNLTDV